MANIRSKVEKTALYMGNLMKPEGDNLQKDNCLNEVSSKKY